MSWLSAMIGLLVDRFLRHRAAAIFLLALGVRLCYIAVAGSTGPAYDPEVHRVGQYLAAHGEFAAPSGEYTGPTATVAPGYPALLALAYRWAPRPELAICLFNSTAASAMYAAMPWAAGVLELGESAGILVGVTGALLPYTIGQESLGGWEATSAAFLLLLALAAGLRGTVSAKHAIRAGLVWGTAFLFAPNLLPAFLMTTLAALRRWKLAALTALVAALAVAPWMARNYLRFGDLFWIRSNLGLELALANNDQARPLFWDSLTLTGSFDIHPQHSAASRAEIRKDGEPAFMQRQRRAALAWIAAHPRRFAGLTAWRFWYFWCPSLGWTRGFFELLIGIAGAAGAILAFRRRGRPGAVLLGTIGAYPLLYYVVNSDPRYRQPLEPILRLCAAYLVLALYSWWKARPGSREDLSARPTPPVAA